MTLTALSIPSTRSSSPAPENPPSTIRVVMGPHYRQGPSSLGSGLLTRLLEEGSEILERLGIRPGPDAALPSNHRFRIDQATARRWAGVATLLHRLATAVVGAALVISVFHLVHPLAAATWTLWKVAGISAAIVGLVGRHAELQLRAQLQQSAGAGRTISAPAAAV